MEEVSCEGGWLGRRWVVRKVGCEEGGLWKE